MKRKNGFTLIELLAVIVILAIIALIAVPIVLNIINSAQESGKRASIDMYAKAIEDSLIKGMTSESVKIDTGIYKTSESNPEKLENEKGEEAKYKITYTGNRVYCEYIEIGEKGTVYVSKCKVGKSNGDYVMIDDAYYSSGANKEGNLKDVTTKENYNYMVIKDALNNNVVDYKIYGNSTQEGTPTLETPVEIENVGDLVTSDNCSTYGNNACNNIGKYVIPIKVSGKNLFDYNSISYGAYDKKENNGYFRSGVSIISFGTYETLENYIGETVTISFDLKTSETGNFSIYQYQSNGIGIKPLSLKKEMTADKLERISLTGKVSVLGTNDSYSKGSIAIYQNGYTGNYTVSNIQFELGEEATNYTSYQTNIINIYLDEPLRKIGDYADYIDLKNKKVVRNVYEKTVDLSKLLAKTNSRYFLQTSDIISSYTSKNLPKLSNGYGTSSTTRDIFNSYRNTYNQNSKFHWLLSSTYAVLVAPTDYTIASYFETIKDKVPNGFTFQYVLNTPKEESIDLPDINLFEGYNKISIDTKTAPSKFNISYKKK